jgi:hypothetical protein
MRNMIFKPKDLLSMCTTVADEDGVYVSKT